MSTHEYDLIANAYVSLLRLPPASPYRHMLHGALISLREELQSIEAKPAEHIQTKFEEVANLLEKQEPLGRTFEQVLFDNVWELYSR